MVLFHRWTFVLCWLHCKDSVSCLVDDVIPFLVSGRYFTISNSSELISGIIINFWSIPDIFALVFLILGPPSRLRTLLLAASTCWEIKNPDLSALIYIFPAMIWPFLFRKWLSKQFICCESVQCNYCMLVLSGVLDVLYTSETLRSVIWFLCSTFLRSECLCRITY